MPSTDDRRRIRFWRPDTPHVTAMLRVEREDRLRTTFSDQFLVVVVVEGAFDGWYRGTVRTHVAGAIKLKEPGEIHRDLRVHAPFTIQGAGFAHGTIAEAAEGLGLHGPPQFRASGFGPGERASQLAFAMHAALVDPSVSELERSTLVAETLGEILGTPCRSAATPSGERARRAVRRARSFLHDAMAEKITLDDLSMHAGLDKFHLVRAFRAEVGVPPYEYLTHVRVSAARKLLESGARVADTALTVGFYDESQLHRHFRRILGIPPGRFARQHRPIAARERATHSPHARTSR